jgi:hypothetical protein
MTPMRSDELNEKTATGQYNYSFIYRAEQGSPVYEGVRVYRAPHEHLSLCRPVREPYKSGTSVSGD